MGMPEFQLQPGQTYSARFEIYAGPKLYHRLAQLPHNEAEIMDFGMFKIVCQFLLNFMNLLIAGCTTMASPFWLSRPIIKLTLWPIQNKANRSMQPDGPALAKNAGAERQIQRRSDPDEPGGDEAL